MNFHHVMLLLSFSSGLMSRAMRPTAIPMPLHPPLRVPDFNPLDVFDPKASTFSTQTQTSTNDDDDFDFDTDDDTIGDSPQQLVQDKNTLQNDDDAAEVDNNDAVDIMRLMRGGRGRKSVHSNHNPKPELKHCYSSEPGGQRGSWSVAGGNIPEWNPNKRCTGLIRYTDERVVQCIMSAGDGGLQDQPVWIVLAGDFNILATYECMTGITTNCVGIYTKLRDLGYERLIFGPTKGKPGNPSSGDSDTYFWPPQDHLTLPPLRISFRHIRRVLGVDMSQILHDANNVTRDWNEMHESDNTIRINENWIVTNSIATFGHIPDALLFSTGRPHVPRSSTKECTFSRSAANFLKSNDRVTIKRQLWISVGGMTSAANNALNEGSNGNGVVSKSKGPTNQQCLWDAECTRMQCKHHRIPFVNIAERTSAAELPPFPTIFEKDGKHYGVALEREIIRNWLPQLCHELNDVTEK
jgi:hypothetical protein